MPQRYIQELQLRFFENDPGLLRLRRAFRIMLCVVLSVLVALLASLALGLRGWPGEMPLDHPDPRFIFPAMIVSLMLAGNIAGDTARDRRMGMARNFLAALLITIPACFVHFWSPVYWGLLILISFVSLYLRRFGASWAGMGVLILIISVFVPKMEITLEMLPRFLLVLILTFFSCFFVSFHLFPVRLRRALLDCLGRYLGTAALIVSELRSDLSQPSVAPGFEPGRGARVLRETLFLWIGIASGVISRDDPAWKLLSEIADLQYRLGKLLKIIGSSLGELSSREISPPEELSPVLEELEKVLRNGRESVLTGDGFPVDLSYFSAALDRLTRSWEGLKGPINRADIQIGRMVIALEQFGQVLSSLATTIATLAGEDE